MTEIDLGEWEEKTTEELLQDPYYNEVMKTWRFGSEDVYMMKYGRTGESFFDVQKRTLAFMKKIAREYQGKTVVVVTHQLNLLSIAQSFKELSVAATFSLSKDKSTKTGSAPFEFFLDKDGKDFDLHRPVIDSVELQTKDGQILKRDQSVIDVWFDSGAMPFAQYHYPFERRQLIDCDDKTLRQASSFANASSDRQSDNSLGCQFPADYICEAIDQTRGWFYTLLATSTLLDRGAPYKNVICLAHINDKHGKKMSKSKGNVVDPWEMMERHGADALRMLLYTMNQPGETKNFDPRAVEEIVKKNWLILWNVLSFYNMFADSVDDRVTYEPQHILDIWLDARTKQLVTVVTDKLDQYDITTAGREIITYINELSTIYVQYSRGRFKGGGDEQAQAVFALSNALHMLSLILAPFTPFIAEQLFADLCRSDERESVHMQDWPKVAAFDEQVLQNVQTLENVIERALALRAHAGIKVRQPLSELIITNELSGELKDIVAARINVKQVSVAKTLPSGEGWTVYEDQMALSTVITKDLHMEGLLREMVRNVNSLRKQAKLTPQDTIELYVQTTSNLLLEMLEIHGKALQDFVTAAAIFTKAGTKTTKETVMIENEEITLGIKKV